MFNAAAVLDPPPHPHKKNILFPSAHAMLRSLSYWGRTTRWLLKLAEGPSGRPVRTPSQDARSGRPARTPSREVRSGRPVRTPGQDARSGRPARTPGQDARSGRPTRTPGPDAQSGRPVRTPSQDARSGRPVSKRPTYLEKVLDVGLVAGPTHLPEDANHLLQVNATVGALALDAPLIKQTLHPPERPLRSTQTHT